MSSACSLTDDAQAEFFHLARDTISKEMRILSHALQYEMVQELHSFLCCHPLLNMPAKSTRDLSHGVAPEAMDTELMSTPCPQVVPDAKHGMMPPSPITDITDDDMEVLDVCVRENLVQGDFGFAERANADSTKHKATGTLFESEGTLPGALMDSGHVAEAWEPERQGLEEVEAHGVPRVHFAPCSNSFATLDGDMSKIEQVTKVAHCPQTFEEMKRLKLSTIGSATSGPSWSVQQTQFSKGASHATFFSEAYRRASTFMDQSIISQLKSGQITWRVAFYKFVKSDWFDYTMGCVLALNAIVIGAQVDALSHQNDDTLSVGWRIVDILFCVVFSVEIVMRSSIDGAAEYLMGKQWRWNVFDVVIVAFQIIDEVLKLSVGGESVTDSVGDMGVIKMMRLCKLIRLIRMVRLIPELKSIVYLISASMYAFLWTFFLMFTMVYCVAVYFTEVAIDMGRDNGVALSVRSAVKENFGSVSASILSLFEAVTGGDDWKNFIEPFEHYGEGSNTINTLIFSIYISFASLVMLNLVTGVFVDGAQRMIQEEKEESIFQEVRKLFNMSDVDMSGEISFDEFAANLHEESFSRFLQNVELGTIEANSLFRLLDRDSSGMLDVTEFVEGCLRLRGPSKSVDLSALRHDFDEVAKHWSINFETMSSTLGNIGHLVSKMHGDMQSRPTDLPRPQ